MATNPYGWAGPSSNGGSLGNRETAIDRRTGEVFQGQVQQGSAGAPPTDRNDSYYKNQLNQPAGPYAPTSAQYQQGMNQFMTASAASNQPNSMDQYNRFSNQMSISAAGDRSRDPSGMPSTGTDPRGRDPSYPPPPFQYSQPSMENIYSSFPGGVTSDGSFDQNFWRDQKSAGAYQAYSQNMMQPLMNYYLQATGQDFQNQYNAATLNEQMRLNDMQHALAMNADSREAQALQAQMGWNERDFMEAQRQFNQQQSMTQQELDLQRQMGTGRLDLDRQIAQNQYGLGGRELDIQEQLGQGRLNLDQLLGTGRLDLDRMTAEGQLGLGRDSLELERLLGTGRLGLDTELGQGRLALDRNALEQEAQLMRERMANEMMQSRMAAFGRSQAPNFRAMNSWR